MGTTASSEVKHMKVEKIEKDGKRSNPLKAIEILHFRRPNANLAERCLINRLRSDIALLEKKLESAERSINGLRNQVVTADLRNDKLQSELDYAVRLSGGGPRPDVIDSARSPLTEPREYETFRNHIRTLQNQLKVAQLEQFHLNETAEKYKSESLSKDIKIAAIERDLKDKERKIAELQESIRLLELEAKKEEERRSSISSNSAYSETLDVPSELEEMVDIRMSAKDDRRASVTTQKFSAMKLNRQQNFAKDLIDEIDDLLESAEKTSSNRMRMRARAHTQSFPESKNVFVGKAARRYSENSPSKSISNGSNSSNSLMSVSPMSHLDRHNDRVTDSALGEELDEVEITSDSDFGDIEEILSVPTEPYSRNYTRATSGKPRDFAISKGNQK